MRYFCDACGTETGDFPQFYARVDIRAPIAEGLQFPARTETTFGCCSTACLRTCIERDVAARLGSVTPSG